MLVKKNELERELRRKEKLDADLKESPARRTAWRVLEGA